jgi:anti-anti-sigma factor
MREGDLLFKIDLGSRECGGHVVVTLRGELDLVNAADVAAAIKTVSRRQPRIIVDLAGLKFIDASGVSALSRGRRNARHAGGNLLLAAPQPRVRRVLAIIWDDVYASVAEAAASAAASSAGDDGRRPDHDLRQDEMIDPVR